MQLVTSIGEIIARFNDMRISHPRADSIFDILDAMREGKRKISVRAAASGFVLRRKWVWEIHHTNNVS